METDRSGRANQSSNHCNRLREAPVRPIQVPLALGCTQLGVDRGAEVLNEALRARVARPKLTEIGSRLQASETIPVAQVEFVAGQTAPGGALYVPEIAAASSDLAGRVRSAIDAGALALTLGGDHAVSIGSVAGAAAAAERLAVLWIDAHADMNWPEVSPSGHVHGMPLGAALGRGPAELTRICGRTPKVRPEDTYLLGLRNLDPGEQRWLHEGQIHYATMPTIDASGLDVVARDLIARIQASGVDALHVSFDVDVLDPLLLPGTGFRDWGGFTFREAARLLRLLRDADLPIRSLDWVELNPELDPSGASTAVATELLTIALGEDVL